MSCFLSAYLLVGLATCVYGIDIPRQIYRRIDCYPERYIVSSNYSKQACLERHCLFDDHAYSTDIQCYTIKIETENRHQSRFQQVLASLAAKRNKRQMTDVITVKIPDMIQVDPKYRLDCAPDIDEYRSFCQINLSKNQTLITDNQLCAARGCAWDPNASTNIPTCYIPLSKGGYSLVGEPRQISNAIIGYNLTRRCNRPLSAKSFLNMNPKESSNEFSMFHHDIENLDVQVSVSGTDSIRMTIRDSNAQRYEVPVPIQWEPSVPTPSLAKFEFQMTKTCDGHVGFRVQRKMTRAILFDTSFFAHGFIYDDKFIQVITTIPSQNIYGRLR
jgi:hypothetical protein